ncbi:isochorismatase domain-containing protein 1-like isoform X2 [Oratosquilla oratoria]|uniref:isochorismatase domain-containing protein 1-like isoform X2 n=1 Tax=Oratosquilla oratoria TaxID=337810 RepID=UPI003F76ACCE
MARSKIELGALNVDTTVFFLCDIQEKFRPVMRHFSEIIENSKKLLAGGKVLGVLLIATEQYPKGLGNTVTELDIQHAAAVVPKTKFSMVVPEVEKLLLSSQHGVDAVVLFGIETHVCVEQTAIDLLSRGVKVHVVADCCSSRSQEDRTLALQRLQQVGCFITTSESVLFKLLGDKEHPKFKEVANLVKTTSQPTGLTGKF